MTRAKNRKELLSQQQLERSHVVANAAINRERNLSGINSYAREVRFDPLRWLAERIDTHRGASWLDLCCGTGKALLQAADHFRQNWCPVWTAFVA